MKLTTQNSNIFLYLFPVLVLITPPVLRAEDGKRSEFPGTENSKYLAPIIPATGSNAELSSSQNLAESPVQVCPNLDVYEKGNPDTLRIFDNDGGETPFYRILYRPEQGFEKRTELEITSYQPGKRNSVLDIKNNEDRGRIDRLYFKISGKSFLKKIIVYAKKDPGYERIATGKIFDFSPDVNLRKTSIKIPPTSTRNLRLEIQSLDRKEIDESIRIRVGDVFVEKSRLPEQVTIVSVSAHLTVEDKHVELLSFRPTFSVSTDEKQKNTIIEFDNPGTEMLEIEPKISDPFFYRSVSLEKNKDGEFHSIFKSSIYRLASSADEDLILRPLPNERTSRRTNQDRYRIIIQNENAKPLSIPNITIRYTKECLIFLPRKESNYFLGIGGSAYNSGNETENLLRLIDPDYSRIPQQRIGSIMENPAYKETPDSAMTTYLFQGTVAVVLLVLFLWLFLLNRKKEDSVNH